MKARRAVVVALAVEEKKGGAHRNSCASIRNRREYEMTKFVFHFATPNSTLASFLREFFRTNICHGSPPRWVCVFPPVFQCSPSPYYDLITMDLYFPRLTSGLIVTRAHLFCPERVRRPASLIKHGGMISRPALNAIYVPRVPSARYVLGERLIWEVNLNVYGTKKSTVPRSVFT